MAGDRRRPGQMIRCVCWTTLPLCARALSADSAIDALRLAGEKRGNEAQYMREFIADGGSLIGLVQNIVKSGRDNRQSIFAFTSDIPDNGV